MMQIEIDRSRLNLARDGLVAIRDGGGTRIVCHTGSLWITQECEFKDVVISAGDTFTVRNPGLTLLTALSASELTIIEPRAGLQPAPAHPAASRKRQCEPAIFA